MISREVFHALLERELEYYVPLFHINDSTNDAKKSTSKSNWTRGITLNVHDKKVNGNIIIIDKNRNIINPPQRFLYGIINKTNTKRTWIKRFQFKNIIPSFGHNGGTSSNITKSKAREVIPFNF